jgi:FkbM family methyltransferase
VTTDRPLTAGDASAPKVQLVSTPGGRVFVDEADQGSVARALRGKGRYEKVWTTWMQSNVRPGTHALDIGANVGYYTALLATLVGSGGSVIACEPDPQNAALLRRTIAENGFSHVRLVEAAVSDRVGRATLYQDAAWHGVHSLARDNCVNQSDAKVDVATVTVDSLMADHGAAIGFVKIDAQGAEAAVMAGAESLLSQAHATVLLEVWPHGLRTLGGSIAAMSEPFRRHGFASFTFHADRDWGPIAQDVIERRAAGLGTWSSFNLVWVK